MCLVIVAVGMRLWRVKRIGMVALSGIAFAATVAYCVVVVVVGSLFCTFLVLAGVETMDVPSAKSPSTSSMDPL